MSILNPKSPSEYLLDARSREAVEKTVAFFETKGKRRLREDDQNRVWYRDFLDFIKGESLFADFLTPPSYGGPGSRWDTYRNCALNEVLGFYGLCYWYTWQVSILGLGPIWMSPNEGLKRKAAEKLRAGGIFAFGLSEKEHGADIYSTAMRLHEDPASSAPGTPSGRARFLAKGSKYYIGNANEAAMVSVFGKMKGAGAGGKDDYVFFVTDPGQPGYELVRSVTATQSYVAEFNLNDVPVDESSILLRGRDAWDAALNTVNVGKYNLGWASIGISAHAFHEALNHAVARRLYGHSVSDFPHVRRMFLDAWARLVAMKLFALRAADYQRAASRNDRRYLLYNPVMKMKVTTEGERVIDLLWDVIAAKGLERDVYFEMAVRDIRQLPKLEGTVHVNIALIVKFMGSYFFNATPFPEVGRRTEAEHDAYLFDQGSTGGLSSVRFHDYRPAFARFAGVPNVGLFLEQVAVLEKLLLETKPTEEQEKDIDFLLALGEMFALVVHGQLVLENAALLAVDTETVDQIFDFAVRDFSAFALELHGKAATTARQMELCLAAIRRPAVDPSRARSIWEQKVLPLYGSYRMND